MLEDTVNLFDATIDEDSPNECLKDIAHNLTWLEDLYLTIVHFEVLLEGISDVPVQIVLLVKLLLLLFLVPILAYLRF